MTNKLVIFGTGDIAQLAHYYFTFDSDFDVVAFTVDSKFSGATEFCDLPVVDFETIEKSYPPEKYSFFVALSYSNLNELRKQKYLAAKSLGYQLASYISSKATILNDKNIGENCFILENNTVQPFTTIGNNVTLWSGNHIGHHSSIDDHTFISSHVVISGGVSVGEQCFLGVNATLRDHISIGSGAIIGAAAVIMNNVEQGSIYAPERTKARKSKAIK
jgi:sugar O-acyltransferase (sialic acid O-acetyltransferase NeuD family)